MPGKQAFNLLMITLDAVRPDHLGCYGYLGVETPNLDALALRSIFCEQAVTHAPNTWVSHATLFTGCLPSRHALRAATHRLSSQVVTLAEWLSRLGYATAAFPGTTLMGRPQGFNRGFDLFDEQWLNEGYKVKEILWRLNWTGTLDRARTWMDQASEPFFVWVHYIDTHHLPKYDLPKYYRMSFSPRWQHYDGKISYADQACIGNLLAFLDRSGFTGRTIVMVLSDHGEELHDDDRAVHDGNLKDDVIRVPLLIGLPPALARRVTRVSDQVRLVDIFPTACDLLELPHPTGLHGRSLLSVLDGLAPRDAQAYVAYLENFPRGYLGARTSEWKLILQYPDPDAWESGDPSPIGLYHLPTDPQERLDVAARHPSILQYLKASCLQWVRSVGSQQLNPDERERVERVLRELGYM